MPRSRMLLLARTPSLAAFALTALVIVAAIEAVNRINQGSLSGDSRST